MSKPILCLDFDGVIHIYTTPWTNATTISDRMVPGAAAFISSALPHWDVHIFSSRSHEPGGTQAMSDWLESQLRFLGWDKSKIHEVMSSIHFTTTKPPAKVSIDDRALTFNGRWQDFDPRALLNFKPWNKS